MNEGKCDFGVAQVSYLGHVVSAKGVSVDFEKIAVMTSWLAPRTLKELRGFLGLTGYYRRFVKGYAHMAQPLTNQLEKDAFAWNNEAELAFQSLKTAMIIVPVLALPDFKKPFVVETNASNCGIGAVLM